MKIRRSEFTQELRDIVTKGLSEYAIDTLGESGVFPPVAFCAEDTRGQFMGAVVVQHVWSAIYVKRLYVIPTHRNRGLGRRLMEKVAKEAKEQGCRFMVVETFNFQAVGFYKKLGFVEEFVRRGYSRNISSYYLRLDL